MAEVDEDPANAIDPSPRIGHDGTVQFYSTDFNFDTLPMDGEHANEFPFQSVKEEGNEGPMDTSNGG